MKKKKKKFTVIDEFTGRQQLFKAEGAHSFTVLLRVSAWNSRVARRNQLELISDLDVHRHHH